MNNVNRAIKTTAAERWFIGLAPWIVAGPCSKCGRPVSVRTYGIRDELIRIPLLCRFCT